MYELKKNGKVFTSKFVGTGPMSFEKRIYRAAVSQRLRHTALCYPIINTVFPNSIISWCFILSVQTRIR